MADRDLFDWLGQIGDVLTNESRAIVNLLLTDQTEAAKKRIRRGRRRLEPLERDLDRAMEQMQLIERSLGFVEPSDATPNRT